jgi:hypothetical protein
MTKGGKRINKGWKENDGRVSTMSEVTPSGAPGKLLDPDDLQPGIWNVYPVYNGDHMSLQGGLLHKKDVRSFYLEMLSMIGAAKDILSPGLYNWKSCLKRGNAEWIRE